MHCHDKKSIEYLDCVAFDLQFLEENYLLGRCHIGGFYFPIRRSFHFRNSTSVAWKNWSGWLEIYILILYFVLFHCSPIIVAYECNEFCLCVNLNIWMHLDWQMLVNHIWNRTQFVAFQCRMHIYLVNMFITTHRNSA